MPTIHLRPITTCLLSAVILLAGCATSSTAGACGLALSSGHSDNDAIRAVIEAEGRLIVTQDIDALMALWAEDAYVANARHTPNDATDDQFWRGQDAIRHRYVRTVFPGAPTPAAPPELAIELNGDSAVVTATTRIGNEVAPAGDRWVLVKRNGCWQIASLTYNLEAAQP